MWGGQPRDLVVYKVVPLSETERIQRQGYIRRTGGGPDQRKVGLRETIEYAIQREIRVGGSFAKDTHVVVEIRFSPLGVAYYTTLCQGPNYASMLEKKTYHQATDWLVWHFHEDLPLSAYDEEGNMLVTSYFGCIV